jgi:RHS repeat-associated protein
LAYNLVDQVTGITQSGSTTSFTYDALGRRVNETVGSLTTVRHYSDSSDNPEWTTQLSGANLTTEIYTGSLGAGLAVTTTFKGTVRTSSMQLTDIRGHTVTTLDLDSNSVGGWSVYDSFGNPQTSQTNTNLINYSSYSQQERATNTTGLILMGARVYNPKTNQFTSKDPIKGGNENSYTYPNDPINAFDFSGLNEWVKFGVMFGGAILGSLACISVVAVCLVAGVVIGVTGSFIDSSIEANERGYRGSSWSSYVIEQTSIGALTGLVGGGVGASALKQGLKDGTKKVGEITFREFRKDTFRGMSLDALTSSTLNFEVSRFKDSIKPSNVKIQVMKISRTGGGGR